MTTTPAPDATLPTGPGSGPVSGPAPAPVTAVAGTAQIGRAHV